MGAMLPRSAALLSLVAGAGLAPFGAPQGGYVTRDFPSLGLEMPIAREVYSVVHEGAPAREAYRGLTRREAGAEHEPG